MSQTQRDRPSRVESAASQYLYRKDLEKKFKSETSRATLRPQRTHASRDERTIPTPPHDKQDNTAHRIHRARAWRPATCVRPSAECRLSASRQPGRARDTGSGARRNVAQHTRTHDRVARRQKAPAARKERRCLSTSLPVRSPTPFWTSTPHPSRLASKNHAPRLVQSQPCGAATSHSPRIRAARLARASHLP